MAGASLKAALTVNFLIGVMKTIVGLLTGSAGMISEAIHSYADTFNQILLALGIRRSEREPDLEHPFGYQKVQFFWALIVAILIFGISGTYAMYEGLLIVLDPDHHILHPEFFIWQVLVLSAAIVLEYFALRTAIGEAQDYKEKIGSEDLMQAVEEMQDPVLLSLLVEDSLALVGLVIALIGSVITYLTGLSIWDGITSMAIGIVLMSGGLLLARENKKYLIGIAVSPRIQEIIRDVVDNFEAVEEVNSMKTMLLGPDDMLLALDLTFTEQAIKGELGAADDIDELETLLCEAVPMLTPGKIYIETQKDRKPKSE